MAKYQKYAEYKDSGVEWLGEIPSHWDYFDGKRIFSSVRKQALSSDEQLAASQKYGVIPQNLMMQLNDSKVMLALKGTESFRHVEKNNFVISLRSFEGGIEHSNYEGCVSPAYTVLSSKKNIDYRYFKYLFKSAPFIAALQSTTDSLRDGKSISYEQFGNITLPLFSKVEQNTIANFLDHETAKIDHLIEKQQQLIELLKEKRQAVISHAVTKGLNPNVAMKDSGVEWLGQVPEHWQLVPLKYLCTFSGGGTPTKDNLSYWTDGNIPWVSPKDMKTFWISKTQDYITEKAVKESSTNTVEQNSLLMVVRSGILQRTIPIAINTVPVTMNQDMKALKFGKRVLVEYIANLIHGNTVQLLLEWSKEGATVESIEHEYLANSLIPVPSLKEQEEITQVIAKKMKVYAELTEKAELQITLLQERRTTLISAAVTGKIDVRNWQAPTVAEADTELSA
ncbi:TPA: restriction endonuclease subunit S [Acinetobacter baumannii]|nr:restriction endonuclease subunit S [Acinetobacter baumannii]